MKREHTLTVGRFEFTGEYEAVLLEYDGSWGMRSEDLGRLELQAAIAVLGQPDIINGDELRFARKAIGLRQPELGGLLDVSVGTVSRWETGAEPIQRQTQLAVLLLLEHTLATGSPTPSGPSNDTAALRRINAA
jgi:DNA-binding transcriptional regulator YiaG